MPKMADLGKMLEQSNGVVDNGLSSQDKTAVEIIEKLVTGLRHELGFGPNDGGLVRKHASRKPDPEQTVITPDIVRDLSGNYLFGIEATQDKIRLDLDMGLTRAVVPIDKQLVGGWAVVRDGQMLSEMPGNPPSDETIRNACTEITKAAARIGAVKKLAPQVPIAPTDWRNTGRGFR